MFKGYWIFGYCNSPINHPLVVTTVAASKDANNLFNETKWKLLFVLFKKGFYIKN